MIEGNKHALMLRDWCRLILSKAVTVVNIRWTLTILYCQHLTHKAWIRFCVPVVDDYMSCSILSLLTYVQILTIHCGVCFFLISSQYFSIEHLATWLDGLRGKQTLGGTICCLIAVIWHYIWSYDLLAFSGKHVIDQ